MKIAIIVIIVVIAVTIGAFVFMLYKDRTYFQSPPYENVNDSSSVLVVYYSRSGNSEALAREIARQYSADILRITEGRYTLDIKGWRNAVNDAEAKVRSVPIEPATYDLTQYELIFLGSPVWLFRPAPPLWSFVENSNFNNKRVVLFNTFNSRYKDDDMSEFRELIEERGGTFIDHIYIRRGKVLTQMSGKKLLLEAKRIVKSKREILGQQY